MPRIFLIMAGPVFVILMIIFVAIITILYIKSALKRFPPYIEKVKDNNQEGAIPVILTLLQIKRRFHGPNFIFSTSLILEQVNNLPCETDLVVLNYRDNENIEVGIGECKSDSGKIDNKDITNLKITRKQFEKKGLKCYLIFSKTADKFTKDEIYLFKKLAKENINPILFTNKELEPYEPYEEYDKSDLPRPYAFTLEDMARNSSYIYLR